MLILIVKERKNRRKNKSLTQWLLFYQLDLVSAVVLMDKFLLYIAPFHKDN